MLSWLKRLLLQKDELIGKWSNEDGSGISMVYGAVIIFEEKGYGRFQGWNYIPANNDNGNDVYNEYDIQFTWKRLSQDTIEVCTEEKKEVVQYRITKYKGYTWGDELIQVNESVGWFYGSHYRF